MSIASRVAPISINRRNPSPSSPHFNVTVGPINRNPYLRTESNSSRQRFLRMAMDARLVSSSSASSSLLLTSGASGRINALFSRRAMMSLLMLIHAFVLLLLLPFRWRPKRVAGSASPAVAEKGMDDKKQVEGGAASGQNSRKVGSAVVRVRTPWWKAAAVVEQEVAMRRALAKRRVLQDDDENCVREFSLFTTARGATLFTQSWTPVNAKMRGLVVLLHGLNEHSGRYNNFAKKLNANGFKVYGMDWIGHGGSDGLHSYVHSLDFAVSDLKAFIERVQAENPGYPCFCFGHSTGAAIILKAALDPKVETRVAGLVITSPAVGVQPSHPIYTVLAPIVSILFPRYQIGAANKKGLPVSRDPAALVEKYSDPLVYTGSIRGSNWLRDPPNSFFLAEKPKQAHGSFLVLHGTADTVTDPKASLKLYQEASSTDKTIKLLEGYLHDLLFEPEKEAIAEDIIQWLNSRVQ